METKISRDYDGQLRTLYGLTCKNCLQVYWVPKHVMATSECCDRDCLGAYKRFKNVMAQVVVVF